MKQFGIVTGGITIALDGESALDEACGEWPLSIEQASYDLLQEIRNRVRELPIDVKWRWIEGHQKEKGVRNLDWWARRNDDVDAMAKSYLAQCTAANRPQIQVRLLYEKWAVYVHGAKQAKIDKKELYRTLFAPRTINYYENHHDIPIPNGTAVDWEASRLACNRLLIGLRRWKSKFLSGSIGVGHMLMHRRYQDHSNCPLCGKHGEKVSHVLRCQDDDAIERVIEPVEDPFTKILVKHSTAPCIKAAILQILPALRRGEPIAAADFSTEFGLHEAIEEQETLGWNNYLLGRWSPKWQTVQAQYFASISSQKTSRRWATAISYTSSI